VRWRWSVKEEECDGELRDGCGIKRKKRKRKGEQ